MGIREKLNEKPGLTAGVVGAIVVLAIVWIIYDNRSPSRGPQSAGSSAFYTEDDGQNYFSGSFANLGKGFKGPGGKEAVRAYVFRYGKEKPFVAWMEKHTPAGNQILATFYKEPGNEKNPPPAEAAAEALIKAPGGTWVRASDRVLAGPIKMVPEKGDKVAEAVLP